MIAWLNWLILLPRLAMRSVPLALRQIWANRIRSILTTIGIVIGVASVTAVIAALTGMKASVLSEFESFGVNNMFVMPYRPPSAQSMYWRDIMFEPALFDDLLASCPAIARYSRIIDMRGQISTASHTVDNGRIFAVDPAYMDMSGRTMQQGRAFSWLEAEHGYNVCMITPDLRDQLGLTTECVGQSVRVHDRLYRVVGVVNPEAQRSIVGGGGVSEEVFVPFATLHTPNSGYWAMAASRSPEVSNEAQAQLRFYMRVRRGIGPGDPDTFRVEAIGNYIDKFKQRAAVITTVAAALVGISLIVGGVGIMNIMLVSVSERTREIGLRKAVGARPVLILLQFLVEAVVLCLLGGLIGLTIGQGLAGAIAKVAKLPGASVPAWGVLLALGFSAGVGVVFGMFPAVKASRLDPIEALRHE